MEKKSKLKPLPNFRVYYVKMNMFKRKENRTKKKDGLTNFYVYTFLHSQISFLIYLTQSLIFTENLV